MRFSYKKVSDFLSDKELKHVKGGSDGSNPCDSIMEGTCSGNLCWVYDDYGMHGGRCSIDLSGMSHCYCKIGFPT